MPGYVLLIEGSTSVVPTFATALQEKAVQVRVCTSGRQALALLAEIPPLAVVVNAPSLRSTGERICEQIKRQAPDIPLVWIVPAQKRVKHDKADVVLHLPFTVRKLYNRLRPYLENSNGRVLQVGVLKLDLETRQVTCLEKESYLTPRLVRILRLLIERRGQVVTRQEIFQQVWKTEYVEDMRTLDVHISWLRKAIEENPRKPRFLKTVRGVGYLLDL